jgi:hypothetical protein
MKQISGEQWFAEFNLVKTELAPGTFLRHWDDVPDSTLESDFQWCIFI